MWPPQRRIGQLLGGKYRIQEVLALGGMGVVYSGRHEITGRSVAIKLLRPELATQPDLLRRVTAEARLAVEASHANVVEVLDAGADELGTPYLILERLYGKSLERLIGAPLSLLSAARVLVPVMNALAALHRAGIVHRDIKPSNMFLSHEGGRVIPKLLDFGIAKALFTGDSTHSGTGMGTPSYMAPEQALGYAALGPATDVWSMGVVLVRCLTGRLPFEALPKRGPSALRSGLQPGQWAHVPESVGAVLVRALQFDPHDRFPNMAELRSALLAGFRQTDELENWPGEATVSYSISDFTVGNMLGSDLVEPMQTQGLRSDGRPARPHDVLTRTLSRIGQTVSRPRWKRVAAASIVLTVSSVLTIVAWRRSELPISPAPEPQTSSLAGRSSVAALGAAGERVNADSPGDSRSVRLNLPRDCSNPESAVLSSPSALAAPTPPLRGSRRRQSSAPPGSSPTGALPALREPLEPALGPNRAPIIE